MIRPSLVDLLLLLVGVAVHGYQVPITAPTTTFQRRSLSSVVEVQPSRDRSSSTGLGYDPKWKKKETLADTEGPPKDYKQIGLIGTVPVVFQQGNETKTTMALPGQPLREVAIQAGQFIKYGCGKGECGTCECLVDGQWIRPCSTVVPSDLGDKEYLVQVKQIKSKTTSSGKFYSVKSFFMGFYNNVLGMVGFVKYRRAAKKNWEERQEYEELIRQKTIEKRHERLLMQGVSEEDINKQEEINEKQEEIKSKELTQV